MDNLLFSSIGLYIEKHPIYTIAHHNPEIKKVFLFYSDEKHPKNNDRKTTQKNIEAIRTHFSKLDIPVYSEGFNQFTLNANTYEMASYMIKELEKHEGYHLVLDLSAARVPIKIALTRAADVVHNYYSTRNRNVMIKCFMYPENGELVEFIVGDLEIPNKKDAELLTYLAVEKYKTQNVLAKELGWTNQSEISKSLKRLAVMGLFDRDTQKVTSKGRQVSKMINEI